MRKVTLQTSYIVFYTKNWYYTNEYVNDNKVNQILWRLFDTRDANNTRTAPVVVVREKAMYHHS